ncbi:SET domain-containing protein [Microthyrium microscopicum]|uniref:SET domain-containing protein n=1 Tax=Microthyrium microscopicum TaxID=703497 RepID=A0A6A6U734_9PEZI|nr:SET domain-containing protein [Microthyrium microscopicum]
MGVDKGFDMVPPLSKGATDRENWRRFIDLIKEQYKHDKIVKVKENYIIFEVGERPRLPFEGHKFLRFSANVSGSQCGNVEKYLADITILAEVRFGHRVWRWSESAEIRGHYGWDVVWISFKSYEEPNAGIIEPKDGSDPTLADLASSLFEIRKIPGKGRSLIAHSVIPRGTRILCEKPLLRAGPMPLDDLEAFLGSMLKAMTKANQRQFLSLHNNFPGKRPFGGIFRTNALPCGSGSALGCVYPIASLINSSCIPNAHNNWNGEMEHETIHAIRDIEAGEEITISYNDGSTFSARQTSLKASFGFQCKCRTCLFPPSLLEASDRRRQTIERLDGNIMVLASTRGKRTECLKACKDMVQLLEEEFSDAAVVLNARVYYDAFQVSVANCDEARASIFAQKAYEARVICEGEDSPETQKMKRYSMRPASHMAFGLHSKKSKSTKAMIPKDLNEGEFEKWMYAQ